MQDFKKLQVWIEAHELTLKVYEITKNFPKEESYGITSQLRRAITSIPSNIAEGTGKFTQLDFANFLNIALGSANESSYLLILSKDLKYLNQEDYTELENRIEKIKAMLISLINKVRQQT